MDAEKEKLFVNKYIAKNKRERILYELSKPEKRLDALGKFCHTYDLYVDKRKIVCCGNKVKDEELKFMIKKYGGGRIGYIISWDSHYDATNVAVDTAISIMRDAGMVMIFISGDVCIICAEQSQSPKEIVVLCSTI